MQGVPRERDRQTDRQTDRDRERERDLDRPTHRDRHPVSRSLRLVLLLLRSRKPSQTRPRTLGPDFRKYCRSTARSLMSAPNSIRT
eukprot:3523602-Rhodomonas_salina.1